MLLYPFGCLQSLNKIKTANFYAIICLVTRVTLQTLAAFMCASGQLRSNFLALNGMEPKHL